MSSPPYAAGQSERFSTDELRELNGRFEKTEPLEIIRWAAEAFGAAGVGGGGLVMTSSFGADSMCTVHLATRVIPDIPIVLINTGYLFAETIRFMEEMRSRFNLNVREYHTHNDPIVWLSVNGETDPRVRNNRDACCAANKNSVMDRAMKELSPTAWIRGVRGDQTEDRAKSEIVQWFPRYNAWAVSPILRWTSRDVFQYMKKHDLPHHPLWEKGYVSIGCNPATCTRPITAGEDERAGRWAGSDKKECGINLDMGSNI
ncbi:MAG TPA: phosphoadenylyl-sulfate reductase [Phycisphaerae bacterium]|nr:phosphoadenylyl-sulfate reductase [Phycisphaerae bacterium]